MRYRNPYPSCPVVISICMIVCYLTSPIKVQLLVQSFALSNIRLFCLNIYKKKKKWDVGMVDCHLTSPIKVQVLCTIFCIIQYLTFLPQSLRLYYFERKDQKERERKRWEGLEGEVDVVLFKGLGGDFRVDQRVKFVKVCD